jgi:hypothetical protein
MICWNETSISHGMNLAKIGDVNYLIGITIVIENYD